MQEIALILSGLQQLRISKYNGDVNYKFINLVLDGKLCRPANMLPSHQHCTQPFSNLLDK